jgi:hypothetical protein
VAWITTGSRVPSSAGHSRIPPAASTLATAAPSAATLSAMICAP